MWDQTDHEQNEELYSSYQHQNHPAKLAEEWQEWEVSGFLKTTSCFLTKAGIKKNARIRICASPMLQPTLKFYQSLTSPFPILTSTQKCEGYIGKKKKQGH